MSVTQDLREAIQAAVDATSTGEMIDGSDVVDDGMVVSWLVVCEVARPGGEGWQWFMSGDSADAGRTFQSREEGMLRYGLRQVELSYRGYEGGGE